MDDPSCYVLTQPQTQRLKDVDYKQQGPSKQSQLTKDEIRSRLENYVFVDDIDNVPLNTHVRYFSEDRNGGWVFRLGGFIRTNNHPDYLILSTNPCGGKTWSVQKVSSRFYRVKSTKDKTTDELEEKDKVNRQYQAALEKQQREIARLRQELERSQGMQRTVTQSQSNYKGHTKGDTKGNSKNYRKK